MIPFTTSKHLASFSNQYINDVIQNGNFVGDGEYTRKCQDWICSNTGAPKALMTTSCTDALEMTAILLNIQPGDEIISPSFTFVSTVNVFTLFGAHIKFIDIDPSTMNMDVSLIEAAITPKTKAILPVHYAGVAVDMDPLLAIAKSKNIPIIEDAAQGVYASYKGRALGAIGQMGAFSFHNTKNYVMGEGGALLIGDEKFFERAEIIREKGTNRSLFLHGLVDKYTWVDVGSSFLASDLNCALLYGQLEHANEINKARIQIWERYHQAFHDLEQAEKLIRPFVPSYANHNAHMYYVKLKNLEQRNAYINYMKKHEVVCPFHYIPLHSSPAGLKYGQFIGQDCFTTSHSERLVRLPLFYGLSDTEQYKIIELTKNFLLEGK